MKKYTTYNLNDNFNTTSFNPFYKSTNYSKILDDLILDDIIEKNSWLNYNKPSDDLTSAFIAGDKKKYTTPSIFDDDFKKASDFLANYGKKKAFYYPFKKDKTYELSDGTIITITDDYIHINEKMYFFNLMDDTFFLNLTPKEKKTICTIYTDSLKITIKK